MSGTLWFSMVFNLVLSLLVSCQQVRIMREKESGDGKGYAFVTFRNKDLASEAIDHLNNTEFKVKTPCQQLQNLFA